MSVTTATVGAATLVTLRWTDRRNALGPGEAQELADAISDAGSSARAGVVLTGEGAFCSGGDLAQFTHLSASLTTEALRDEIYQHVHAVLRAIGTCPVPVVAAVDGPAIGLGFDYALACDMRFVGPNGYLLQGWGRAGLIHGAAGSAFLHQLAPAHAWRLIADQPRLDGPAAAGLGLAEAADTSATDAAVARLERLAQMPRAALEANTLLQRRLSWPSAEFLSLSADHQSRLIGSPEFREMAAGILGIGSSAS